MRNYSYKEYRDPATGQIRHIQFTDTYGYRVGVLALSGTRDCYEIYRSQYGERTSLLVSNKDVLRCLAGSMLAMADPDDSSLSDDDRAAISALGDDLVDRLIERSQS
jgi:hypothetical protein